MTAPPEGGPGRRGPDGAEAPPRGPDEGGAVGATFAGHRVLLLPERALLLRDPATVVVADLHLGKGATFRSHGIPLPAGGSRDDLHRLSTVLETTGAARLVILGDFIHAARGRSAGLLRTLREWRERHPRVEVLLVRGNHDRSAGDPPRELGIEAVDEWVERGILFRHEPWGGPGGSRPLLAGHLHPGVRLRDRGGGRLRLPCFWLGPEQGVLPAFGEFTGTSVVEPRAGDRIFVVGPGAVVEVPARWGSDGGGPGFSTPVNHPPPRRTRR